MQLLVPISHPHYFHDDSLDTSSPYHCGQLAEATWDFQLYGTPITNLNLRDGKNILINVSQGNQERG